MSNDKKHAGKMVVNKYAEGKAKYEHNKSDNIDDEYMEDIGDEHMEGIGDEHMEDIEENTGEWNDHYNSFHNIKNKKQKYYDEQISLVENWKSIIPTIFSSIIEGQGFSENPLCFKCKKEAIVKCLDCGPNIYFCYDCDIFFHDVINLFHQRITKNEQGDISMKVIRLSQICLGECKHEILKVLCVDIKGKYEIEVPICNGLIESLIYNKLFPSTPIRPSIVFTFNVLDLYKELLCEAQVSYLAFCKVLETFHMNKHITKNIYFSFISAFQQYIGVKSKIDDEVLKLYQETKPLFNCPACPQPQEDNAKVIIALDGNFQLRRLKSAGNDIGHRLINDNYIKTFDEYQNWVAENYNSMNVQMFNKNKNNTSTCENNFKAANQLNSYHKSNFLDDTGLFGCTCRHGIPIKFINLRNIGEKYTLAECLISELSNLFPTQSFTILYDIACLLHAHIMNNNNAINSIKSKLNWGVSIFHAYAHSIKCQLKYHPRIQKGIGLTDGESLERIWSYLGRFVSNTKHMRPAHRLDILSLAIQHISNRMITNLGGILFHKFKTAKKLEIEVINELLALEKQHHVTEEIIKKAIKKQQEHTYVFKKHLLKDEIYFAHLMELQKLNNEFTKCNTNKEKEGISKKTSKLLNKINHCEVELNILEDERWNPMDVKYKQYLDTYSHNQMENIIDEMRILRNEYSFKSGYLFNHNHKGHKSAVKIKKSIDNIVKNINNQLISYNEIKALLPNELQNYPDSNFKDVLDHKSDLWKALDLNTEENYGIPCIVLYNAIQNYNNLHRSKEEQILIPQELSRLLNHWKIIKINIKNKLDEINNQKTPLMIGFISNLKHILFKVNNIIEDCDSIINQIKNMQNNQNNPTNFHENKLNNDTYLFTNEFEEVELLKGEIDNDITELDIINNINNTQEYELNTVDEIILLSDSEMTDMEE